LSEILGRERILLIVFRPVAFGHALRRQAGKKARDAGREFYETVITTCHYLRSQPLKETLLDVIPELKDMRNNWGKWHLSKKGQADGYILGKYGLDIFSGKLMVSDVQYLRGLRRVMTVKTLENCVHSEKNRKVIITEAAKRIELRKDLTRNGKIFVKSANVQHHAMQKNMHGTKLLS